MKRGLRRRVGVTFAMFALLVVLIQAALVVFITDAQEEEFIEHILGEEMPRLRDAYRAFGSPALPRGELLKGYVRGPGDDEAVVPLQLRALGVGDHVIHRDGKEFHVHVREDGDDRFYLVYDATRHETRMRKFAFYLLAAVLSAGAVVGLAAYWLSGVLVRQVSDLARRVADLDPAADSPRLANEAQDEEVSTLADAFDRYHERVAEIVEREKQFTSNVSHELRTPLTAIKTSCELLAQDPAITAKSAQRLQAIASAADRMTELAQALLLLARNAPLDSTQEVFQVKPAAEEAAAPFRDSLARRNIGFELRVPECAVVRMPRPAFHLALSNLLRNAAAYTNHGRISVRYENGTLVVADTGRGIESGDLARIFDRFYRVESPRDSPEGIGVGLAIVKDLADRLGWRLGVSSQPGQGSEFMIEFPPSSQFFHG
jgi:signal transduction histidine kinase